MAAPAGRLPDTLRPFDLEASPVDIPVSLTGFTAAMKVMMDRAPQ